MHSLFRIILAVLPISISLASTSGLAQSVDGRATDSSDITQIFRQWVSAYLSSAEPQKLVEEGVQLATTRRRAMLSLIQNDPRQAVLSAIPVEIKRQLPARVVEQLEETIDTTGELRVIGFTPAQTNAPRAPVERVVIVNGKEYRAFLYGKMLQRPCQKEIVLRGITLDGDLAVSDETPAVSKKSEAGISALPSAWTTGPKTLLFIRVDFTDFPGGLSTEAEANALIEGANSFYAENSYGAVSISGTVTPVLRMPKPRSQYTGNYLQELLTDARNAARIVGYDTAQYDLDVVQYQAGADGEGGNGNIGTKGIWIRNGLGTLLNHELGHNFGLLHANQWSAVGDTVVGSGTHGEYGNLWDAMGGGYGQFNACHKNRLGWLGDEFVQTVTTSGVYRLYSFDDDVLVGSRAYALKIRKDFERDYWVEHRRKLISFYNNTWITNGVLINWSPWSQSNGGTHLLNPLPDTQEAGYNSVLVMGRTLADLDAQVFVTPLGKAVDDQWMDVAVNFGPFPSNRPPIATLTVSATNVAPNQTVQFSINAQDPDGDALVYFWDFGRDNFHTQNGPNAATATYSFIDQGQRSVFCVVSDTKGGVAVQSVLVQVGTPQGFRVSGRVTHHGQAVGGAYVFFPSPEGVYRASTYTDESGSFTLTGINPRPQTLLAMKWIQNFNPVGFSNPVNPTNNVDGIRFDDGLPWLTELSPAPGGWSVGAAVLSGKVYLLEGSTNLVDWTTIGQTNAVSDSVQFFDGQAIGSRFYRLRNQ